MPQYCKERAWLARHLLFHEPWLHLNPSRIPWNLHIGNLTLQYVGSKVMILNKWIKNLNSNLLYILINQFVELLMSPKDWYELRLGLVCEWGPNTFWIFWVPVMAWECFIFYWRSFCNSLSFLYLSIMSLISLNSSFFYTCYKRGDFSSVIGLLLKAYDWTVGETRLLSGLAAVKLCLGGDR